uniref:Uncharacterized protein n=1 Tax=Opuntia streptacantha TaxID=393608 RepID=A0A7C9A803_OPUST
MKSQSRGSKLKSFSTSMSTVYTNLGTFRNFLASNDFLTTVNASAGSIAGTGNSRTLAICSRRASETPRKSLPGSFSTSTPSLDNRQNPSHLSLTSSFCFRICRSFFFSEGYRSFPALWDFFAHRMWRRLKGENEGDEVGFERRESGFGEREERDRELHTTESTDIATGIFWAEGSEECFRVQLIRFFFFLSLSLSLNINN